MGVRPSEREGTGVPRADDSPLFQGIGRQSGALGFPSGDAVTLEDTVAAGLKLVVMSKEESVT